jgi:hypothetical protein
MPTDCTLRPEPKTELTPQQKKAIHSHYLNWRREERWGFFLYPTAYDGPLGETRDCRVYLDWLHEESKRATMKGYRDSLGNGDFEPTINNVLDRIESVLDNDDLAMLAIWLQTSEDQGNGLGDYLSSRCRGRAENARIG